MVSNGRDVLGIVVAVVVFFVVLTVEEEVKGTAHFLVLRQSERNVVDSCVNQGKTKATK